MKKRRFWIGVLSLSLALCLLPAPARAADAESWTDGIRAVTKTWDDGGVIASAEELAQFAYNVNNGRNYRGKTIALGCDISLAGKQWTPIGSWTRRFYGTFDGQGFTVSGVEIDSALDYQGFFGVIDSAVIQNLTVDGTVRAFDGSGKPGARPNSATDATAGHSDYTGGVCAYARDALFLNCVNRAAVSGEYYVGGVCGRAALTTEKASCRFERCRNEGTITATAEVVGGVCGKWALDSRRAVVCEAFADCENRGEILCTGTWDSLDLHDYAGDYTIPAATSSGGSQCTGGVVGFFCGGERSECSAARCRNLGGVSSLHAGTGGVAGYVHYAALEDCRNDGMIRGTNDTGGVAGAAYGATLLRVANYGDVEGTDDYDVGGVAGNLYGSVMTHSVNAGAVSFYPTAEDSGDEPNGIAPFAFEAIGGLAGLCRESEIVDCVSSGVVTAEADDVWSVSRVGSAVGWLRESGGRWIALAGLPAVGESSDPGEREAAAVSAESEQFVSGELCRKLNEWAGEPLWRQTLGEDAVPTTDTERAPVYEAVFSPGAEGDAAEGVTLWHNGSLALPGALYTREGYTQSGWTTEDGADYALSADAEAGDIALTPLWRKLAAATPAPTPEPTAAPALGAALTARSGDLTWLWVALGVLAAAGVVVALLRLRKKK